MTECKRDACCSSCRCLKCHRENMHPEEKELFFSWFPKMILAFLILLMLGIVMWGLPNLFHTILGSTAIIP